MAQAHLVVAVVGGDRDLVGVDASGFVLRALHDAGFLQALGRAAAEARADLDDAGFLQARGLVAAACRADHDDAPYVRHVLSHESVDPPDRFTTSGATS